MALSKQKYPVHEPEVFYKAFPHLNRLNHRPTSNATPDPKNPTKPYYIYNCFAFVVGNKRKFWWPGDELSYWPNENASESVEELVAVLMKHGYEPCANGNFEKGVQKIAIFVKGQVPVHVAIQPRSRPGTWMSKMGYNVDMEHDLHAIETWDDDDSQSQGYGTATTFLKFVGK